MVYKHLSGGAKKLNVVKYFTKPPAPINEYYYEVDTYAVKDYTGGFQPNIQGSNEENWPQGQGTKVGIMVITP